MASHSPVPKNGSVVLGSFVFDFHAFSIEQMQSVEEVTPYGMNVASKNVGNGTPDFDISIQAYALEGATNTPPLFGSATAAGGYAATLTIDTGVSEACQLVIARFGLSTGRMRAAVPYAISGKNGGDMVETWAVS